MLTYAVTPQHSWSDRHLVGEKGACDDGACEVLVIFEPRATHSSQARCFYFADPPWAGGNVGIVALCSNPLGDTGGTNIQRRF